MLIVAAVGQHACQISPKLPKCASSSPQSPKPTVAEELAQNDQSLAGGVVSLKHLRDCVGADPGETTELCGQLRADLE